MLDTITTFFEQLIANPETNMVFAFILTLLGAGIAVLINYFKATCC